MLSFGSFRKTDDEPTANSHRPIEKIAVSASVGEICCSIDHLLHLEIRGLFLLRLWQGKKDGRRRALARVDDDS
jgi:hypothetical protein